MEIQKLSTAQVAMLKDLLFKWNMRTVFNGRQEKTVLKLRELGLVEADYSIGLKNGLRDRWETKITTNGINALKARLMVCQTVDCKKEPLGEKPHCYECFMRRNKRGVEK